MACHHLDMAHLHSLLITKLPPSWKTAISGDRTIVTSSNVLRKGSLQTKLNAGLSEQQQEDLFQNERSFHEVKL